MGKKLRDLTGGLTGNKNKVGFSTLYEMENGTFTNMDLSDRLDHLVSMDENGEGTVTVYTKSEDSEYYHQLGHGYMVDGKLLVLSSINGDNRGCTIFGDIFMSSGHDGSYLWNIKTGEFKSQD